MIVSKGREGRLSKEHRRIKNMTTIDSFQFTQLLGALQGIKESVEELTDVIRETQQEEEVVAVPIAPTAPLPAQQKGKE